MIPAPKLAHPEIFSSIRRFFKPGDFFGTSPLSAFSQFPSGIYLKPVETRQYSLKKKKTQHVKYTSYRGCHNFFRPYPGIFGPHPPPLQKRSALLRKAPIERNTNNHNCYMYVRMYTVEPRVPTCCLMYWTIFPFTVTIISIISTSDLYLGDAQKV